MFGIEDARNPWPSLLAGAPNRKQRRPAELFVDKLKCYARLSITWFTADISVKKLM